MCISHAFIFSSHSIAVCKIRYTADTRVDPVIGPPPPHQPSRPQRPSARWRSAHVCVHADLGIVPWGMESFQPSALLTNELQRRPITMRRIKCASNTTPAGCGGGGMCPPHRIAAARGLPGHACAYRHSSEAPITRESNERLHLFPPVPVWPLPRRIPHPPPTSIPTSDGRSDTRSDTHA